MEEKQSDVPHIPVLLKEVVEAVSPLEGQWVIDGTFGAGGYSRAFLQAGAHVIALDRDPQAIQNGARMVAQFSPRLQLLQMCFSDLAQIADYAPDGVDAIVLDIGVSSMQIDQAERGFSFQKDGPLDMRMSQNGLSAADVVNQYDAKTLARIFYLLGEEDEGSHFARAIEKQRQTHPFTRTSELAKLIVDTTRKRGKKGGKFIHPATRVFQALRIYINDELMELAQALFAAEQILKPGGRLVVVTFHSLEDRIVKRFFAHRSQPMRGSRHLPQLQERVASFEMILKGGKSPSCQEIEENPRARSAKIRAGRRTSSLAHPADYTLLGMKKLSLNQKDKR